MMEYLIRSIYSCYRIKIRLYLVELKIEVRDDFIIKCLKKQDYNQHNKIQIFKTKFPANLSQTHMNFQFQTQLYEYTLNILSIKMQVNFPCKMKVEYNSTTLTTEIPSNGSHRFTFNEEISIREQVQKQCFELQVNLLTDKGAKYTAGIVKLFHNELIRSQGERIVIALTRCLDKEAFCEIKVDKVNKSIVSKRSTFGRSMKQVQMPVFETQDIQNIVPSKNRFHTKQNYNGVAQTKSQFQFPINNNRNRGNMDWDQKSREVTQTYYQRNASKSPITRPNANRSRIQKSTTGQQRHQFQEDIDSYSRDKLIEAEVYKQEYTKLKQKYKKEAETAKNQLNKRIELQNSQNTLKLQAMKYKLKAEEYERASNDKNGKIKQLQGQLTLMQQRQAEIQYLKNELQQKDHQLRVLEDTIRQFGQENDELKSITQNKYSQEMEKIAELNHLLDANRNKYEGRLHDLEKDLKISQIQLNNMDKEIIKLNAIIDQERNTVTQLQNALADKTYEYQRVLQNEKSSSQHSLDDMYSKLQRIQKELTQKEHSYKQLHKENEKLKTTLMKLQYDKKILLQDNEALKSEYQDVKRYKQKYSYLFKDHKLLIEDRKQLEKQLDKTIAHKDINIQEINFQYNDQIQYYKRINREVDQRAKTYSNKIIELEGQMDIVKSHSDKVRRNNQNLIKDLAEAKEKEKQAKKQFKTKQQEILSLEAQYSTIRQKSKNIDQIFKLETDKLKDEIEKLKNQLQNQYIKNAQLSQTNSEIAMELSKVTIKLQFTQQRLDKDSLALKDRQMQLQNLIKDYQGQVSSLEETVNHLRHSQKQLSGSLLRMQNSFLKAQQSSDKKHKQLKAVQEKLFNAENSIRGKQQQISNLQYDRQQLQKRVNELEDDLGNVKNDNSVINNEKNKGLKVIQIYEDDLKKAKHDIQSLSSMLAQKEKEYEHQKAELKTVKEEQMRSELRHSALKKETDRFRDSLIESLNTSFMPILSNIHIGGYPSSQNDDSPVQLRSMSWLSGVQIDRNKKAITESTTWTEIVSTIISHSKDLKLLLNRLFQQVKTLQKQVQRMAQQSNMSSSKHQSSQFQLQRTINELQNELSSLLTIKEQQAIKYDHVVQQMSNIDKQKDNQINDLHQEMEELHFTLNSMNMDYQQASSNNVRKLTQLKKQKNQYEQKYEQLCEQHVELEDSYEKIKIQLQQTSVQLQTAKATVHHQILQLHRVNDIVGVHQMSLEQLKRGKKVLLQKISSIELQLSTQIQLKSKTQLLLMDQEKKNQQLKDFTHNLMKQKEAAIKSQLVKAERITHLQTQNIELQRDRDIVVEENQRVKNNIDEIREQFKTVGLKAKCLEDELTDAQMEKNKLQDKIKEKDRQLQQQLQFNKKLQAKHEKLLERTTSEKHSLEQELEDKNEQLRQRIQESNQKSLALEKTLHQKESKILHLENTITYFEEELLAKKTFIERVQVEIKETQTLLEQEKARTQEQTIVNQELLTEIKEKEENMFELSGKLYNLELRLTGTEAEYGTKLQELDQQWIEKYDSLSTEYQQRLELIEKERDYFQNVVNEKEHEISALKSDSRNYSQEQSTLKKTLEQKIKKLEEDRLQLFTLKTIEIQTLNDQTKRLNEVTRQKESELRRVTNELEIARASITKTEQKNKDFEDKLKNINKLYNTELQQLKKKQQAFKGYKEWIVNQQWAMEREMRKLMQSFIKRFLENIVVDEKTSNKMVDIVKNFENTLIDAVTNKLQEQ